MSDNSDKVIFITVECPHCRIKRPPQQHKVLEREIYHGSVHHFPCEYCGEYFRVEVEVNPVAEVAP